MMSDFAPEVAKYPKSSPKLHNFWSVWAYCFAPLVLQLVYYQILLLSNIHGTDYGSLQCADVLLINYSLIHYSSNEAQILAKAASFVNKKENIRPLM